MHRTLDPCWHKDSEGRTSHSLDCSSAAGASRHCTACPGSGQSARSPSRKHRPNPATGKYLSCSRRLRRFHRHLRHLHCCQSAGRWSPCQLVTGNILQSCRNTHYTEQHRRCSPGPRRTWYSPACAGARHSGPILMSWKLCRKVYNHWQSELQAPACLSDTLLPNGFRCQRTEGWPQKASFWI